MALHTCAMMAGMKGCSTLPSRAGATVERRRSCRAVRTPPSLSAMRGTTLEGRGEEGGEGTRFGARGVRTLGEFFREWGAGVPVAVSVGGLEQEGDHR